MKFGIQFSRNGKVFIKVEPTLVHELGDVAAHGHQSREHHRTNELGGVFDSQKSPKPIAVRDQMVKQERIAFSERVVAGVFELRWQLGRCPTVVLRVTGLVKECLIIRLAAGGAYHQFDVFGD